MSIFVKYAFIFFVSAIGVTGQLLLKKGLGSFNGLQFNSFLMKIFSIITQPLIIIALSCYVIGMVAYLFLISKIEVSSVYPICSSLTFGGITLFGWLLLSESLGWHKILGITFIIIGIFLIDRMG